MGKKIRRGSFFATVILATFFVQSAMGADTRSGGSGKYKWTITYIKTEKSKRKVEDEKKTLVHYYSCKIMKGEEVIMEKDIVSNGRWMGGEISTGKARKNAAEACKSLAAYIKG